MDNSEIDTQILRQIRQMFDAGDHVTTAAAADALGLTRDQAETAHRRLVNNGHITTISAPRRIADTAIDQPVRPLIS